MGTNLCIEAVVNILACGFAIVAYFFNGWVTYESKVYDIYVGLTQLHYDSNDPEEKKSYTVNNWCASADNLQDGLSRKDSLIKGIAEDGYDEYVQDGINYCTLTGGLIAPFLWIGVSILFLSLMWSLYSCKREDTCCKRISLIFTYGLGFISFCVAVVYGHVLKQQFCDLSDPEVCYSNFCEYFAGIAAVLAALLTVQQLISFFAVSLVACCPCLQGDGKPQNSQTKDTKSSTKVPESTKGADTKTNTTAVPNQTEDHIAMVSSQV